MSKIVEWLLYSVPWWLWCVPLVAIAVPIFLKGVQMFGFRNAFITFLGAILPAIAVLAGHRGKQKGWEDREKKEKADVDRIVQRADKARMRARSAHPDRLRDDDGFKRE